MEQGFWETTGTYPAKINPSNHPPDNIIVSHNQTFVKSWEIGPGITGICPQIITIPSFATICRVSAVATGICPQIITIPSFMTFCRVKLLPREVVLKLEVL